MDYGFDFSFLSGFWPDLLKGTWLSIKMSALSLVLGFLVGVALAVARTEGGNFLKKIAAAFVDLIRNTPLVVQTFWLFFGLAAIQIRVPAFYAAIVALTINTSAYTCEIVRAGIDSIHKGQKEAAACLSLSKGQILGYIVLPQAVEKMYPALISQFVLMMLATSIMSQISAQELTAIGYQIQSETFRGFEVYLVIAVIYLFLSWLLRLVMNLCHDLAFPRKKRMNKSNKK
ncbi:amino acid ABC transporter permease [Paralcaligenes ginsengisoli]